MTFFSAKDPGQVLKDLLRIELSSRSESADLSTSSIFESAGELLRLNNHGSDLLSDSFKESNSPDMQSMNPDKPKQHIMLLGSDANNVYPVFGSEVEIVASRSSGLNQETQMSDKISVTSVDKCDWKQQYYFGNLVTVHQSKAFVAYAMKDKASGVVKVLNCEIEQSIVLDGFAGSIVDVSFANSQDVVLAAADQTGDLRVFKISILPGGLLMSDILLHLQQFDVDLLDSGTADLCCRVAWCPFVPEKKGCNEDDADDIVKTEMLLAFSCNSVVRVLSIDELHLLHKGRPVDSDDLKAGCCVIDSHSQAVFDMALVPGGSTLATASADGYVRFHELDFSDYEPPKCLFEWQPHSGRPVSLIIFLDDLKNTSPDVQWWKYVITGTDQSRELKLWTCETWTCLQSLTFSPSPYVSQQFQVMPCIKACLDASATYLVLSDIMRKTLYVLSVEKGSTTRISSVSEFLLVQPCLGLAIEDTTDKDTPLMGSCSPKTLNGKLDTLEQNHMLSLYTIHTKALDHLRITFMLDDRTLSPEFPTNVNAAHDSETVSPVVVNSVDMEEDQRKSLEIVPSESSSFTLVTSMDEGDHPIDVGSKTTRVLSTGSVAAAETGASRDLNQVIGGHRPSTELSCALAHISSIQLPVQTSFDAKGKISSGHSAPVVVSSSGDFPYPVLGPAPGARPKERSPSRSADGAYGTRREPNDAAEFRVDSSRDLIVSSYSDVSLASEHQSEGNGDSPSEWFGSEPLFHNRGEVSQNKRSKEDVHFPANLKTPHSENKDAKAGVESPRVREQPNDLQSPKSSGLILSSPHVADKSSPGFVRAGGSVTEVQALEISKVLKELRETLEELHEVVGSQSTTTTQINDLQAKVNRMEKLLVSGFKDTMDRYQKDKDELRQQISNDMEAYKQQQLQQQLNLSTQIVRNCLHSELGSTIEYEMQNNVLPGISNILEPVAKKLTEELSQKLTATDAVLKDSVKQLVRSKTMTEVIGKVVSNNLETVLHATCRDQLIPAFDRGCQNVLGQVNETFQKGLNSYTQQMQKQAEKLRVQSNETGFNSVVHQLQGMIAGLVQVKGSCETLNHQVAELIEATRQRADELERQKAEQNAALAAAVNSISTQLSASVRELIRKEMSSAFREHEATINEKIVSTLQSRSSTPAPQVLSSIQPLRTQITALVQRNHMNAAFQQALSAVDLGILMYLCEMVDPDELFARTPFPLDQPILLSLIQQLSADLRIQTQLKCRYLEEALLNVDQKSPVMQEHLPAILEQLATNADVIQHATGLDPSLRRPIKRLIMAARFLCHSLLSPSDVGTP